MKAGAFYKVSIFQGKQFSHVCFPLTEKKKVSQKINRFMIKNVANEFLLPFNPIKLDNC